MKKLLAIVLTVAVMTCLLAVGAAAAADITIVRDGDVMTVTDNRTGESYTVEWVDAADAAETDEVAGIAVDYYDAASAEPSGEPSAEPAEAEEAPAEEEAPVEEPAEAEEAPVEEAAEAEEEAPAEEAAEAEEAPAEEEAAAEPANPDYDPTRSYGGTAALWAIITIVVGVALMASFGKKKKS